MILVEEIKAYEPLWGCWYVKEKIGEGAFSKVYQVEREEFGKTYTAAVKFMTVPGDEREFKHILAEGMSYQDTEIYFENVVRQIVREFEIMYQLKGNSNIVSYEDHMVIRKETALKWHIFIRMEHLTSLVNYIENNTIKIRDVIQLGIDICKALELCQKYNVIHRDIKPDNIFVAESGNFKLGDFGISKQIEETMTHMTTKRGTKSYIAPEVYKGESYNSTVDIYSLGIVMYRLLNQNRVPFLPQYPNPITFDDQETAFFKRLQGEPMEKPLFAEGRLAEIVLKACAFSPKERYASPLLMRQELEAILYEKTEAKVIYPCGDEANIKSIQYMDTNDGETETIPMFMEQTTYGDTETIPMEMVVPKVQKKGSISYKKLIFVSVFIILFCGVCVAMFLLREIPITAIEVAEKNFVLEEGEQTKLQITIEPENTTENNVQFTAQQENIASVDERGIITAVQEGKGTITITSENVTETITVEVKKKEIPVTQIQTNAETYDLKIGETAIIQATVLPENATQKTLTFSSDNSCVLVDQGGTVAAVTEGKANITIQSSNDIKKTVVVSVTQKEEPKTVQQQVSQQTTTPKKTVSQSQSVPKQQISVPPQQAMTQPQQSVPQTTPQPQIDTSAAPEIYVDFD